MALSEQKMITMLFVPNIESAMDMIKKKIISILPNANKGSGLAVAETGVEEEEQEPNHIWTQNTKR